jgi:hypothetical protein
MPELAYHYNVKFLVVDAFGDVRWQGTSGIAQEKPFPDGGLERVLMEAQTAKTIRSSAPSNVPAGRVLIAAVLPAGQAFPEPRPEPVNEQTIARLAAEFRAAHNDADRNRVYRKIDSIAERHQDGTVLDRVRAAVSAGS